MAGTYELWNMRSKSIFGVFDTEAAALAGVRAAARAYGRDFAEQLALGHEDRRGRSRQIAAGAELAERALARNRSAISA
jgi:hypothetical protein